MTGGTNPDKDGKSETGQSGKDHLTDNELDARSQALEDALSVRRRNKVQGNKENTSGSAGYAQALRLSSEFIAGILVGAAIGWVIDKLAGTSPWGFIVFFFLGFCAGVLNVMRSAGVVAEKNVVERDHAKGRVPGDDNR